MLSFSLYLVSSDFALFCVEMVKLFIKKKEDLNCHNQIKGLFWSKYNASVNCSACCSVFRACCWSLLVETPVLKTLLFFIHKNVPPAHQAISLGSCGSLQHNQVSILTWKWEESRSWALWETLARQGITLSHFPQTTFFWNDASRERVPTQTVLLQGEVRKPPSSWAGFVFSNLEPLFMTSHLATFQRLMNGILSVLIYHRALVYIDGGTINSLSWELHLQDSHRVLRRQEKGITMNYKVCQFWEKPADFLGH